MDLNMSFARVIGDARAQALGLLMLAATGTTGCGVFSRLAGSDTVELNNAQIAELKQVRSPSAPQASAA
jgi:hypothetical protein